MNNGYGSGKDTRQTALRDLYVKLGGNIADVAEENDINRLIRALGDVAGGGGGGGGALVVNLTETTTDSGTVYTCDKTAGEMYAAAPAIVFLGLEDGFYGVTQLGGYGYANGTYIFAAGAGAGALTFTAASADAYPQTSGTGPK